MADRTDTKNDNEIVHFIPFRVPIEKRFKVIAGLWRFSGLLGQKIHAGLRVSRIPD